MELIRWGQAKALVGRKDNHRFGYISIDDDTNRLQLQNWVYNPKTLVWEKLQQPLIAGAAPVVDLRVLEVQEQILTTLQKIERHLSMASDTELNDQDV